MEEPKSQRRLPATKDGEGSGDPMILCTICTIQGYKNPTTYRYGKTRLYGDRLMDPSFKWNLLMRDPISRLLPTMRHTSIK